ncbi:MAG: hypothetical protein HZY75_13250 [Nocardioidaceae bacterium]|nr:MAG: hypothetical protein HZY75_13250 [Nocardioidaceae bacterium]
MSEPTCAWCHKTCAPGITLCPKCVTTLDHALANIAAYWRDLDTIRTKQARYSTSNTTKGSVGKTQPLPVDGRFTDPTGYGSEVVYGAKNTLVAWAKTLIEDWPPANGPACPSCLHVSCHELKRRAFPRDTMPGLCAYIAGWRHAIAATPWATDMLDELLDVERRLRKLIDRPADGWYAGECGSETDMDDGSTVTCTRALYAEPGSPFVRCRDCGCTYDTEARRATLLAEAEDREATVRILARVAYTLKGIDASESRLERRIAGWVKRGKIKANGTRVVGGKPLPVYRVGDVIDLLTDPDDEAKAG